MRSRKFVLDTNIWISYLINKKENELIDIIVQNELVIYSCDELLYEIRNVLNYKHLKKYNIDIKLAFQVIKNPPFIFL